MAYSSKTTASTKYRVSGGNSVISTTFSSQFEAIGRAFKVRQSRAVFPQGISYRGQNKKSRARA